MRTSRILANAVGIMLLVQVILGGSSVLLNFPIVYHLIWGTITFIVLIVSTLFARRDYGSKSTLFRVSVAAIGDFVFQGLLGLGAFGSDVVVVVHLTNAFILAIIVTYMVSFADSLDKTTIPPGPGIRPGGTA